MLALGHLTIRHKGLGCGKVIPSSNILLREATPALTDRGIREAIPALEASIRKHGIQYTEIVRAVKMIFFLIFFFILFIYLFFFFFLKNKLDTIMPKSQLK